MAYDQVVADVLAELRQVRGMAARLASQLRECAETLGADQFDEQRAMRAYADSMALLEEMSHIRGIHTKNDSLMEQTSTEGGQPTGRRMDRHEWNEVPQ
ncbi:hypothetical protein D9M69_649110 [compost metagenome]